MTKPLGFSPKGKQKKRSCDLFFVIRLIRVQFTIIRVKDLSV